MIEAHVSRRSTLSIIVSMSFDDREINIPKIVALKALHLADVLFEHIIHYRLVMLSSRAMRFGLTFDIGDNGSYWELWPVDIL